MPSCDEWKEGSKECCLHYDAAANGGNENGRPDGMEVAHIFADPACDPTRTQAGATGGIDCGAMVRVVVRDDANMNVGLVNRCCQVVKNTGRVEDPMVVQVCSNVGVDPRGGEADAEAKSATAAAGGEGGVPPSGAEKDTGSGCQLRQK